MFFDIVQYSSPGWMSRNRILKPNRNEAQYINIGLQKIPFKTKLPSCKLIENNQWKTRILAQLEHYKKKAPFYTQIIDILRNIFDENNTSLLEFNMKSIKTIASVLNISTPIEYVSTIESQIKIANEPAIWGLNICKARGASIFINAPGGEVFFPKEVFNKAGIKLGFIQHKLSSYKQYNTAFIPGLSIIDVLMFNGIDKTSELVNDYSIKWISDNK